MSIELKTKRYFLFDLDGTLVDSSLSHEKAYIRALSDNYPDLASAFWYENWKGYKTLEVFKALGVSDDKAACLLTEAKQRYYLDEIDAGAVKSIPFAADVLQTLRNLGCRCFLVTSASRRSAQAILKHLSLDGFFDLIVTGDEVQSAKPAPDCYLRCIHDAKIATEFSVAVEDARAGVASARSAGLSVIAVNNEALRDEDGYMEDLLQLQAALTKLLTNNLAS